MGLLSTVRTLHNTIMTTKLSMDNIAEFAKSNPFLDMRQIEEWRIQKAELARLGIDLSPFAQPVVQPTTKSGYEQRISLKYF